MRTVLLVDDSDVCSTLMEIVVSGLSGIRTQTVRSASQARAALSDPSLNIALVITDLQLPDEDGYALIRQMRESSLHEKTPVIVVSGVAHTAARQRLASHRIAAYFEKPCSPALLRKTIEDVLHER